MSASHAHLHALAERTLDAHERRAGELRGRLAPILAAGAVATALLTPQALAALPAGGPPSAAAFVATLTVAFATVATIGTFLRTDLRATPLALTAVWSYLKTSDALDDETDFHEAMASFIGDACDQAEQEVEAIRRQFTAIMCGILVVLCGLALTAVVA